MTHSSFTYQQSNCLHYNYKISMCESPQTNMQLNSIMTDYCETLMEHITTRSIKAVNSKGKINWSFSFLLHLKC